MVNDDRPGPSSLNIPLDLTEEADSSAPLTPIVTPYDPAADREKVRTVFAAGVVAGLLAMVFFSLFSVYHKVLTIDECKALVDPYFTPLLGLAGTVVGFYYGEKSRK